MKHPPGFCSKFQNYFVRNATGEGCLDLKTSNFLGTFVSRAHHPDLVKKAQPSINVIILTGYPELEEAVDLVKAGKVTYYVQKTSFSKVEQKLLIYTLKKHFSTESIRKVSEDNHVLLKKWRQKTWWLLVALIVVVAGIIYLSMNEWDPNNALASFKRSEYLGWIIGSAWFLTNTFLLKKLYDQYFNFSNIVNYLNFQKSKKAISNK